MPPTVVGMRLPPIEGSVVGADRMMIASSDRRRCLSSDCHAVLAVNSGEQFLDKYQKVSESSRPDCGACRLPLRGIRQPIFTTSGEDRHVRNALQAPRGIAAGNYAWRAVAPPAADAAGGLRHPGRGRMRGRSHPAFEPARTIRPGQHRRRSATASRSRPPTLPSSSSRSRSPSGIRVRSRAIPMPGTPAQPRSDRRPGLLPVAGRPECRTRSRTGSRLRPAHGRRILQQPVPGPREVRRRGPAVPAPDDAGLQRRRGQPDRFLRPWQRHHPELVVRAEEGLRVRHAAACDQQPDRRPDVDQPGSHRRGRVPGAHAGQPRRASLHHRSRPGPPGTSPACPPAACRRTRRCSSRT